MLNQSANVVNASIQNGIPTAPGYLIATLQAFNATPSDIPDSVNASTQTSNGPVDSANTGLAMSACFKVLGVGINV
jgi:hypothetical protein